MAKIGFSTLGCPHWSLEETLVRAAEWEVDCLELRILDGKIVEPNMPKDEVSRIAAILEDAPVKAETLATSVKLAHGADQIGSLGPLMDIASAWNCQRIRVFMGPLDGDISPLEVVRRHADALIDVLDRAGRQGLEIALETHDSLATGREAAEICEFLDHGSFKLIWDTVHTTRAGETPVETWTAISGRINELQVKDAVLAPKGSSFTPTLLGTGRVRWQDAIELVGGSGFDGTYMLEWEKAWHPEIPEPEVAMPHDLRALRQALAT